MKTSRILRIGTAVVTLALASACSSTRTHESAGEYVDDAAITAQVKTKLAESPQTKAYQMDVETFRGVVQLNGYVDADAGKQAATTVARSVAGVKEVRNNLVVSSGQTAGAVVDDSVITAKIKTELIADPKTKAGQINVTTENGMVQLAGFVDTAAEKAKAEEIARSVSGVRGVRNELDVKQP
jgi:hyperosmotically inducible protein